MTSQDEYLSEWVEESRSRGEHSVFLKGMEIVVPKDVFSPDPNLTYSSMMVLKHLRSDDVISSKVIDVGTGSGVLAIWAAENGAESVKAVDISVEALSAAARNIKSRNLEGVISVKRQSLLDGDSDFDYDLILANLPILMEQIVSASDIKLLKNASSHLTSKGKLYFASASFGKHDYLLKTAKEFFDVEIVKETRWGVDWFLYICSKRAV